ncbi:MAG: hypothetical protein HY909_13060 [Deltaproteobacteria bacterium]|nr:hypothetical protein [Deltaproteobacteria bacterium]
MRLRLAPLLAVLLASGRGVAQPAPVEVPWEARLAPLPRELGTGAQYRFLLAAFGGFPQDIADARDFLEGRSLAPGFHAHCGLTPYVDFTNATVRDSLGLEAPKVLCLPFLDPDRRMPAATCRPLPGAPTGRYFTNGGAVLRIEAALAVREAGPQTFAFGHDDGFSFSIAGRVVFEFPGPTGSRVDRVVVRFPRAGLYPFRLDWYDTIGGALLDWYRCPGDCAAEPFTGNAYALVDTRELYPTGTLPCAPDCAPCPASAPRCDVARGRCVACTRDPECLSCERCVDGSCVRVRDLPDAEVPAGCRAPPPDAASPDGPPTAERPPEDRAPQDATEDTQRPTARPPGCGCGVASAGRGAAAWAFALLGARRRRRRRG